MIIVVYRKSRSYFKYIVRQLVQCFCYHNFCLDDIFLTHLLDHCKRVSWSCVLCNKTFYAHCGLDISSKYGTLVRKKN